MNNRIKSKKKPKPPSLPEKRGKSTKITQNNTQNNEAWADWCVHVISDVEQELLTLRKHLSSSPFLVGFVLFDLLFSMFYISLFVLFHFVIVSSVLRYTASDCPFGIFNFSNHTAKHTNISCTTLVKE